MKCLIHVDCAKFIGYSHTCRHWFLFLLKYTLSPLGDSASLVRALALLTTAGGAGRLILAHFRRWPPRPAFFWPLLKGKWGSCWPHPSSGSCHCFEENF